MAIFFNRIDIYVAYFFTVQGFLLLDIRRKRVVVIL